MICQTVIGHIPNTRASRRKFIASVSFIPLRAISFGMGIQLVRGGVTWGGGDAGLGTATLSIRDMFEEKVFRNE